MEIVADQNQKATQLVQDRFHDLEATTGFEPVNGGFANLWLTTCLRRQRSSAMRERVCGQVRS